jgi:hypothetical protein
VQDPLLINPALAGSLDTKGLEIETKYELQIYTVYYKSDKLTSMALQPWWTLAGFSVSKSVHNRWNSLDGVSDRRKAATYTQNNTNTE